MLNSKRLKDEHIERLYYLNEVEKNSIDELKTAMNGTFDTNIIDELLNEDIVLVSDDGSKISFSKKGMSCAQQIIRAHRIAERMIYDVLGNEFESGACEFEHIVTTELVDSICILLGHPRDCPHGMPIPEGECCKRYAQTTESSVTPLTDLAVGQSARVAYVKCKNDQLLHKMDGLQIRPKILVKIHQVYPTYVIECEGAHIALDEEIVSNIYIWKPPKLYH